MATKATKIGGKNVRVGSTIFIQVGRGQFKAKVDRIDEANGVAYVVRDLDGKELKRRLDK